MTTATFQSADVRWNERMNFCIASYPDTNRGNPYVDLFQAALRGYGVRFVGRMELSVPWIIGNAGCLNAIHIHWPEKLWRGRSGGRLGQMRDFVSAARVQRVIRLGRFLQEAGRLGIKRIWTVHNLGHHEGATAIDRWGYSTLANHCDLLIVHSDWAAEELRRQFGFEREIVVMRHGTYVGAYPEPDAPERTRKRFELSNERPIIFFCGLLRRYKGIEVACEAARRLGERVQLLVAGRPKPSKDRTYWQRMVKSVPGAVLIDRSLDDQEFADLIAASDVVLQSYTRITGSGLLSAAWTFGTGVVASDLPFFREMLQDHPQAGLLFPAGDGAALAKRIEDYLAIPESHRRQAVADAAAAHSWDRCIQPVADVFRQWQESES